MQHHALKLSPPSGLNRVCARQGHKGKYREALGQAELLRDDGMLVLTTNQSAVLVWN